jgi:hypothetical protein
MNLLIPKKNYLKMPGIFELCDNERSQKIIEYCTICVPSQEKLLQVDF